jgi:hypothetical protein
MLSIRPQWLQGTFTVVCNPVGLLFGAPLLASLGTVASDHEPALIKRHRGWPSMKGRNAIPGRLPARMGGKEMRQIDSRESMEHDMGWLIGPSYQSSIRDPQPSQSIVLGVEQSLRPKVNPESRSLDSQKPRAVHATLPRAVECIPVSMLLHSNSFWRSRRWLSRQGVEDDMGKLDADVMIARAGKWEIEGYFRDVQYSMQHRRGRRGAWCRDHHSAFHDPCMEVRSTGGGNPRDGIRGTGSVNIGMEALKQIIHV